MSEIIYLQPNEIKKLIDTIDNIKDKALIVTGIETGMRVSEITQGFKIEMINWDGGTAKIWDEKKDVFRDIAIPKRALNLLKIYSNFSSEISRASPPESNTSLITGVLAI